MKKILVIDNYDSFTYNLVHYISLITGEEPAVYRNDEISLAEAGAYDKILLSPGPGIPSEAGICLDLIKQYAPSRSILGICLGHQAIGEAFGGTLVNLSHVFHGLATPINLAATEDPLFRELPPTFKGGRYHSWVVDKATLPSSLVITALDPEGLVMGISHKNYDVRGLQFHPESVLTEHGFTIMRNWVSI